MLKACNTAWHRFLFEEAIKTPQVTLEYTGIRTASSVLSANGVNIEVLLAGRNTQ